MATELAQFNEKTKTKDSLYHELKKMDDGLGSQKQVDNSELEKRKQILKGVKASITG